MPHSFWNQISRIQIDFCAEIILFSQKQSFQIDFFFFFLGRSLSDVSKQSTRCVLQYIYADQFPDLNLSQTELVEVLRLCNKLRLKDLEIWCTHMITPKIDSKNVLDLLECSCKYNLEVQSVATTKQKKNLLILVSKKKKK